MRDKWENELPGLRPSWIYKIPKDEDVGPRKPEQVPKGEVGLLAYEKILRERMAKQAPEKPEKPPVDFGSDLPDDGPCEMQAVGEDDFVDDPFVPRDYWGAMEPRKPFAEREGPVSRIFVVDTRTSQCRTKEQCIDVLQELQEIWIHDKGEDDVLYNFMVGGDGRVYEGRGWKAEVPLPPMMPEAYEDGLNFVIALIGDFSYRTNLKPSEKIVKARRDFVQIGKDMGFFDNRILVYTDIQQKI